MSGCSINPTSWAGCATGALGHAAGGLATAGFDAVAGEFAKGVGNIVKVLATFWVSVPTTSLSTDQGSPVGMLLGMLDWLMLAVGMLSLLLVAGHMALTHRGDVLNEAGTGLARFVLVTSAQIPAVALLAVAGDEFSKWIINTAAGGHFDARVGTVFGAALALGPLGTAVVFIASVLAIFASLAQVFAMVGRNGVLILTSAASPLAGAAAIYKGSEDMWRKLWMWQLAFVLYKPTAAFVYAAAFVTVGDGKSAVDALSGIALMIMSVLAMPALLRLMMPVSAKMSAGGAGGAAAGAGVAAAGIGQVLSSRGRSGGGSGGGGGGGDSSPGPSGSVGVNTSAASGGGAAGGGAAAAAGPVGMAMAAGAQAVGAVKGMAANAASSGTQEE